MTEAIALPNEYGCELSLRIVPGDGKCRSYKNSGSVSCHGCEAWLRAQGKPAQEVDEMAAKCKIEECDKKAQHGKDGMCCAHFSHGEVTALIEKSAAVQVKEVIEATDPRITLRCPHCYINLSSAEIEEYECPICAEPLHTHLAIDGVAFTPPDDFGLVANVDGIKVPFGTDLVVVMALDDALAAKKAEWLVELSGLSPIKTLARANQMVIAISELIY